MTTDTASNVPPAVWKAASWLSSKWAAQPWLPCATIPLGDDQYIELPVCQMDTGELRAAFQHAATRCSEYIGRYLSGIDDDDAWQAAFWLWTAAVCRGAWMAQGGEAQPGADDLLRDMNLETLSASLN